MSATTDSSDFDSTKTYQALVTLEKVEVDNGEKDDTEVYKHKCALYLFKPPQGDEAGEWITRGKGDVRILENNTSKRCRLILRENMTYKLRMNHVIHPKSKLKPNQGSDKAWTWSTVDYNEEGKEYDAIFAIRFKNSEIANEFKATYEKYRDQNGAIADGTFEGSTDDAAPAGDDAKGADAATEATTEADATKKEDVGLWNKIFATNNYLENNQDLTPAQIDAIWEKYDADKSGFIERKELVALMTDLVKFAMDEKLIQIPEEERETVIESVPKMVELSMEFDDTDQDGKISREEFNKMHGISA